MGRTDSTVRPELSTQEASRSSDGPDEHARDSVLGGPRVLSAATHLSPGEILGTQRGVRQGRAATAKESTEYPSETKA